MIVLLDAHALLWALEDSPLLSAAARTTIEDTKNVALVSAASAWEIVIKRALGRLDAPDDLVETIDAAGFVRRILRFEDIDVLASLPSHHRDPFDRMLVAQATHDGVPIVSRDPQIAQYQVQVIW